MNKSNDELILNAYYPPVMNTIVERKLISLQKGFEYLMEMYGAYGQGIVTKDYIYRPFGGWGYCRNNVIVMPEIKNQNNNLTLNEKAYEVFIDLHELAHTWWGIASSTNFDWINEAGAEYSALILIRKLFGDEVYDERIGYYLRKISNETESISIVDTASNSPNRELNHYMKPTLLYLGAEKRYGEHTFLSFLKTLAQQFAGTRNATTDVFLNICESVIGKDAKDYFNQYLTCNGWKGIDIVKDILLRS